MTSFTAKDGDGTNFEVAAHFDSANGIYYPISTAPTLPMISQFADTNGDKTGTFNAIGDYSAVATDFWIEPPVGEVWHIARLIGNLRYGGALRADRYGAVALTNGIKVFHEVNTVETELSSQEPIKVLAQWGSLCHDLNDQSFGTGDNFATWRWTFENAGVHLELDGDNNDKIIIRLEDDFSATGAVLVSHSFLLQGHKLVG